MTKTIQEQIIAEVQDILADKQLSGYVQVRDIYIVMRERYGMNLQEKQIANELNELSWLKCETVDNEKRYYKR